MLEILGTVIVVALLVFLALVLLSTATDTTKMSVDEANARSGYAVVSSEVLFNHVDEDVYVYDSDTGKARFASKLTPKPYGLSMSEAQYKVGEVPVHGVADGCFLAYYISNGEIKSIRWINSVRGMMYRHESTIYANKDVTLIPESRAERIEADDDGMQVMASQFLGMTKGEIIEALGMDSSDQIRLSNDEGVGIFTYWNQEAENPQIKGSTEALESIGYAGTTAEADTNGFRESETRTFFSDYMNSGAESVVKIGKIEYDEEGKVARIKVWVDQVVDNGTDVTVPEELQGTYVVP